MNTRTPVILFILVGLLVGILVGNYVDITATMLFCFTIIVCTFLAYWYSEKILSRIQAGFLPLSFFSVILIGIQLNHFHDSRNRSLYYTKFCHDDQLEISQLRISSAPVISEKWITCDARVQVTNEHHVTGNIKLFIERDTLSENLHYGDEIFCQHKFLNVQNPKNPHEFNFANYLSHEDIDAQSFLFSGSWKKTGNSANFWLNTIYEIRAWCSDQFDNSILSEENKAVAKALILGDKETISDELMLSYGAAGALHVLAVSGLHVGIVMLMLGFVLNPLRRFRHGKLMILILALSGIWFYALLTGLSPSVLRAAVMFSFVLIGKEMQKDTSVYQSLMASAVLIILFDPHVIYNLGFLLSYLAVIGIVFFYPKIYSLLATENLILRKTWQITAVSIAAQLSTFPLSIYCFHQFPNYFLLANLVVIPISFLALTGGILFLTTSAVPLVSTVIGWLLNVLLLILNEGVRMVENLPGAITSGLSISQADMVLLYLFIFFVSWATIKKSKKILAFSVLIFTGFIVSVSIQLFSKNASHEIVFYSVKKSFVADIFQNGEICSISYDGQLPQQSQLAYHVFPHRIHKSNQTKENLTYYLSVENPSIKINGQNFLFLNQDIQDQIWPDKVQNFDILYLDQITYIHKEILDYAEKNNKPVIGGTSLSDKFEKFIFMTFPDLLYYPLKSQGAMVMNY